jgi:hypothetical protein
MCARRRQSDVSPPWGPRNPFRHAGWLWEGEILIAPC